jgi:hypothetical protein
MNEEDGGTRGQMTKSALRTLPFFQHHLPIPRCPPTLDPAHYVLR